MERKKRKIKIQVEKKPEIKKNLTFEKWLEDQEDFEDLKPFLQDVTIGKYIYSFKPRSMQDVRDHIVKVASQKGTREECQKALSLVSEAWHKFIGD